MRDGCSQWCGQRLRVVMSRARSVGRALRRTSMSEVQPNRFACALGTNEERRQAQIAQASAVNALKEFVGCRRGSTDTLLVLGAVWLLAKKAVHKA